jgi:hypothetical protein
MAIVCIERDKFWYFTPCTSIEIHPPSVDKPVSSGNPVIMRVLTLFDLLGGAASPSGNKSKRESSVYISINARDRMDAGFPEETGLSPFGCEKGVV